MSMIGILGNLLNGTISEAGGKVLGNAITGQNKIQVLGKGDHRDEPKEIKSTSKRDNSKYELLIGAASQRHREDYHKIIADFVEHLYKSNKFATAKYLERVRIAVWPAKADKVYLKRQAKKLYMLPIVAHFADIYNDDPKGAEVALKHFCDRPHEQMHDSWEIWSVEEEGTLEKLIRYWHMIQERRQNSHNNNNNAPGERTVPGGPDIEFELGLR